MNTKLLAFLPNYQFLVKHSFFLDRKKWSEEHKFKFPLFKHSQNFNFWVKFLYSFLFQKHVFGIKRIFFLRGVLLYISSVKNRRHPDSNWGNRGFAIHCLTTWLYRLSALEPLDMLISFQSSGMNYPRTKNLVIWYYHKFFKNYIF